jgi:hypothetical protein
MLATTLAVAADAIDRPAIKVGDSWTYRVTDEIGKGWNQTHDEITVSHVTPSTVYFSLKRSGSTQPPQESFSGSDWSRIRDVNGKETVVNRPLDFPLSQGKTWEVSYQEKNPNPVHSVERFDDKFTVVGYEDVEVPMGKFHALKVEAEGTWHATIAPMQTVRQGAQINSQTTTMLTQVQKGASGEVSGKTYKAIWYVPEMERWVKSVEEYYSAAGVRTGSYTQELESFKHG